MIKTFFAAATAATTLVAPAMAQVTSVSQLGGVQPTEWSYQAISNLVSRYGCVAGFPNGTFEPGQPATRAQLAALVNACLDRVTDFQSAQDAQLAAALKAQAAKWSGTQAQVKKIQAAIDAKNNSVGNYVGLGVLLNRQGINNNNNNNTHTISGGTLQARYSFAELSKKSSLSLRPYLNAAGTARDDIGTAGGALVTYDYSIGSRGRFSAANLYAGVGYQVPFVNNSEANYQSAIGYKGQAVFVVGGEGRLTDSLVGFADVKFPTTNAGNAYGGSGAPYTPVFTTGIGIKF
jgi:hypothetical protein